MSSPPATTQTSSSAPTIDPALKSAMMNNINLSNAVTGGVLPHQDGNGNWVNQDGTPYTAPSSMVAGFSPDQQASFDQIRNIANNPLTAAQLGGNTYSNLTNFQAPTVSTSQVTPGQVGQPNVNPEYITAPTVAGVTPMTAGQVGQVGDVTSKNFTDYNLNDYTNPEMAQVVDPVQQYYQTLSDQAASSARSQARAQGAVRGSDPAIAEALARGQVAQQAGVALSPLYQNAYQTAAGLVTNDANRNLSADQGNQSSQLTQATTQAQLDQGAGQANLGVAAQKALTDAQLANTTGLANQGVAMQAQQLNTGMNLKAQEDNQQSGLTAQQLNQQAGLNAQEANQQAGIASAGVQSNAAAGLAGANTGAQNSAITGAGLLNTSGNQQQAQQQALINQILTALGIRTTAVNGGLGSTTGQSSTQTTSGGGSGAAGVLGGLGSLASGIGALGGSGGLTSLLAAI